ncbi:hypothetical protein EYC98_12015 [Halieaceae bacterium IMCC14734]|uniref:Uncharacterized protein n=1 Tax=Candidatus Litorirhabdus singularis TaxID=2518993 RepID=A0ABT3TH27_9GAMM|nr:hypothetical protein [Candidatus Litorirhabdus singularis]MCX2981588.1 hypothetical protein [Candidatus Litorirhabdus singularis]
MIHSDAMSNALTNALTNAQTDQLTTTISTLGSASFSASLLDFVRSFARFEAPQKVFPTLGFTKSTTVIMRPLNWSPIWRDPLKG